jgi:hypothetical protein
MEQGFSFSIFFHYKSCAVMLIYIVLCSHGCFSVVSASSVYEYLLSCTGDFTSGMIALREGSSTVVVLLAGFSGQEGVRMNFLPRWGGMLISPP